LGRRSIVDDFVARIRRHRRRLADVLATCGVDFAPSQANFILAQFNNAVWVRDGLAGLGILVRAFPEVPVLGDRLRITVPGDPDDLERLCSAVETVVRPQRVRVDSRVGEAGPLADPVSADEASLRAAVESDGGRVWFIGADVESIRTARRVGLLPLALATTNGPDASDLLLAGAARVLKDLQQLEELLP